MKFASQKPAAKISQNSLNEEQSTCWFTCIEFERHSSNCLRFVCVYIFNIQNPRLIESYGHYW